MNLRVAACSAGYEPMVTLCPDAPTPDLLARVSLSEAADHLPDAALYAAIAERRTFRAQFGDAVVSEEQRQTLARAAEHEGAWFHQLDGADERQAAAELVAEGDRAQWADRAWRRELAAWMRPRRAGEGLTVPSLAIPLTRLIVGGRDMGRQVGAKNRRLALDAPVLALLGTEQDACRDWLMAGQALERLLLTAVGLGLQASYLNQPVQVGNLRPRLSALAGRGGFAQMLLRLGAPRRSIAAAPRRPVEDVLRYE